MGRASIRWFDSNCRSIVLIANVSFAHNKNDFYSDWNIHSLDGSVHLTFYPIAFRHEKINYGIVKSNFIQPIGFFKGTIKVDSSTYEIHFPGVTEDQDVIW
ncbi:MAG: DUF2804 family protein [Saprospiraceae bacterium]